jgi:carbon monoxide dehydrogenase subunit G
MGRINATASFPADQDAVWAVISDPASYEHWLTIHTKWKNVPERFSEGATASEVVTMLGMPNTIEWTVQQFDAPSSLTIAGTGMAGVRTTFSLSVAGDGNGGSTAQIDAEFEGAMITGALGMAVEKDAKANLDQSLANIAKLVAA